MKFASFRREGRDGFGEVRGDRLIDLTSPATPDLKTALASGGLPAAIEGAASYALSDVILLPPIPNPAKIFCVGLNYEEHRTETGRAVSAYPTIFTRFADAQVGHGAPLIRPLASSDYDFEGELAVVIGAPGRRIAEKDAFDHVAGYACFNDGSIRDWQAHSHQFTAGKNFPGSGAFGPWLVTPDEIADLQAVRLITRLNGQVVQQATVAQMIFSIPRIIAYISSFTRLEPGDVIATGTPGGVGAKRIPPLWMKAGDLVEVEISGVGLLANWVIDEI